MFSAPVPVPIGGVYSAQVAERRFQLGGQLLPLGGRGRRPPGKVIEPAFGERPEHTFVQTFLRPELSRLS